MGSEPFSPLQESRRVISGFVVQGLRGLGQGYVKHEEHGKLSYANFDAIQSVPYICQGLFHSTV